MIKPTSRYIPFLRAKRGELGALGELTADVKDSLLPLLEMQPFDDPGDLDIDTAFGNLARSIARHWGVDREFLIDDRVHDGEHPSGAHPLILLFRSLAGASLEAVPVTGLGRSPCHEAALVELVGQRPRLALRLRPEDLARSANIAARVQGLLTRTGLSHGDIDLLLEIGTLPQTNAEFNLATVTNIYSRIPDLDDWRSVTIAMNSFPEQIGNHVKTRSTGEVDRADWELYEDLVAGIEMRKPDYGDFAVDNPDVDYSEVSGAILGATMVATIRYSTDDSWLILRGAKIVDEGNGQYQQLAEELIRHPKYKGSSFSAGDAFATECAAGMANPGNAERWRKAAVSHHLTQVVWQLSSLI